MKDLDTIDVTLLRTFRAVVTNRSMARAATELGYVPSAVSQHVARLERLVGVQLITRSPGEPIAPTAAGREVAERAANLLAATADFATACRAVGTGAIRLRVAAYATAASELLPGPINELHELDPGAQIGVIEAEPADGLPALIAGDVDLLIAYRYLPDEVPSVSYVRETLLSRERLPVVRHADAPADGLPWIVGRPQSPSRRLLEHWAAATEVSMDIRYEVEHPHTVLSLCAHGLGQGMVPISVLRSRPDLAVNYHDLHTAGVALHRSVLALTRRRYAHPLTALLCDKLIQVLTVANGRPHETEVLHGS